jgi:hypothetical protein
VLSGDTVRASEGALALMAAFQHLPVALLLDTSA